MEGQPQPYSLTITLPDSERKLQYSVQREAGRLVIKPDFEYWLEEGGYVFWHLLSKKNLSKQKQKRAGFPFPQDLLERPAGLNRLVSRQERRAYAARLIREQCQPLASLRSQARAVFASLSPEMRRAFVHLFLGLMEELAPEEKYKLGEPPPALHWPEEAGIVVFAALTLFGSAALRPRTRDELDCHPFLDALHRLALTIWEVIEDWQRRAQEGDLSERRLAQRNLRRLGGFLVPPTQGKRQARVGVPDLEVKIRYYKALFGCELASGLLAKMQNRIRDLSVAELCAASGLPSVPEKWGFTARMSDPEFIMRNLRHQSAKENACILVANQLGATVPTIRNIVSR